MAPIVTTKLDIPHSPYAQPIRKFSAVATAGTAASFEKEVPMNGIVQAVVYSAVDIPTDATYTITIEDEHGVERYNSGAVADNNVANPVLENLYNNVNSDTNKPFPIYGMAKVKWTLLGSRIIPANGLIVIIELTRQ